MTIKTASTAELRRVLGEARASTDGAITAFNTCWNRRSLIARIEAELAHRAAAATKPPPEPAIEPPEPPEPPALDDEQDIHELQQALLAQFRAAGAENAVFTNYTV